ncbi:hypothetical protein MRX96_043020 [Rhipicephalus microplus]
MVITAATLLLLVVIGAVLLAYFYGSKMKRKKVATCVTDDCIAFGEELSAAINKAADPCHDFHAYVCGTGDNPVISDRRREVTSVTCRPKTRSFSWKLSTAHQIVPLNPPKKCQFFYS